jgi:hypothetical protein
VSPTQDHTPPNSITHQKNFTFLSSFAQAKTNQSKRKKRKRKATPNLNSTESKQKKQKRNANPLNTWCSNTSSEMRLSVTPESDSSNAEDIIPTDHPPD